MAEYAWMDDLTSYKQNLDTVLVTGRSAYDVVVRGTQLMNMAGKALGTLDNFESKIGPALGVLDKAGAQLGNVLGFVNFAMEYLDTIVEEISSLVESIVQEIIDEVFQQLEDLYDSVLESIQ